MKSVRKYWYFLLLYLLFSYVLTQIVVTGSAWISTATDKLFAGEQVVLEELLLPFILLAAAGGIAAFVKSYAQSTYSIHVQTRLKCDIVKKLVHLRSDYLDMVQSGSIMNRVISDMNELEELFSRVLPDIFLAVITVVTVGIYIFFMDEQLFFVTIVCYPVLFIIANRFSKRLGQISGYRRALYDRLEETALDNFNGMLVGKSYNLYSVLYHRITAVIGAILKNEYPRTFISSFSFAAGNLIRWIPQIICYLFALYEVVKGKMSMGDFLSFAILLERIAQPVGEFPGLLNSMREEWVSFQRIEEILKQPEEISGKNRFALPETGEVIAFQDITFSYAGNRNILNHLNLSIEKGKHTALVGASGGGKSTVFKIICGFYRPQGGTYRLYGQDFTEWDIREARKQFALVSQNVFLFPGTIYENVAYGKEGGADRETVITACKAANIHSFIMELPNQYDTYVGERGVKLSGGQRQRLSIARAFIKQAPILLLDEPTSAVDVDTEELIQTALAKIAEGKTVITIAHRLSTIENADKICVFEQGNIAEQGTHKELMQKRGSYYRLYYSEGGE